MPKGIYFRTEEAKNNMSMAHKGKISWKKGKKGMKGHPQSEETKRKLRESLQGQHRSIKTEFKNGHQGYKSMLGKHLSEKSKLEIGLSGKGRIPWNKGTKGIMPPAWNKGITMGEELRKKNRESHLGQIPWNKGKKGLQHHSEEWKREKSIFNLLNGIIPPSNKGIPHTEETKNKIGTANSVSLKKYFSNPKTREILRHNRAKQICPLKDTSIEVKIQNFLKQLGIEYFTHKYMNIEHAYQCDVFVPSLNLVIECDGNYWHSYPTGKEVDHIRTKELIEKGFKVLRLWETEIKGMSINIFKETIEDL